ncbi:intradiol ring-cleavage dioxygenase [Noviherbaspirillum agri]
MDIPESEPVPRRRKVLLTLGAAFIAAQARAQATASSSKANGAPACVLTPAQTEGPYFVDERLNRSDIRTDPSDGSQRPGMPLSLTLRVHAVDGARCTPLRDAIVDIWHCDANGIYSDVADPAFDTSGKKFLRGYQHTNADGMARFLTIYPGWYPGRAVHIHFKVRAKAPGGSEHELTSQLYFDDALTDRIHSRPPYVRNGQRAPRNASDGIFRRGGRELMLSVVRDGAGYAAVFDVGLRMG